jgi:hypothetical protein
MGVTRQGRRTGTPHTASRCSKRYTDHAIGEDVAEDLSERSKVKIVCVPFTEISYNDSGKSLGL